MNNAEFVYLLGMIVGKGTIVRNSVNTEIRIEIPHKNLRIEDSDIVISVKASLLDIKNILEPLIDTRIGVVSGKGKTTISFTKNSKDFLIREINRYLQNEVSYQEFRIPEEIFQSPTDIKKEFLSGLADVTAHIRRSNNYLCTKNAPCYGHRVYIEVPKNWYLTIDIANLLLALDIPVHTINWGHPNTRDPNLRDYKKGRYNSWIREHQIKIFAEEFEKVGFRVIHKMRILKLLADLNRREWDRFVKEKIKKARSKAQMEKWEKLLGRLDVIHHRFYWETKPASKKKPTHPLEKDERIPDVLRGRHFDSWREIAEILGYPRQ